MQFVLVLSYIIFVNRSLSAFRKDHNVYTMWSEAVLCTGSRGHSVNHARSNRSNRNHRRKRAWPSVVQSVNWQEFLLLTQWNRNILLKSSESCKSEPHRGCHVSRVNMFSNHALPSIPGVLVCRLANRMCRRQPCRPPGLLGSPLAKYKCSSSSSIINIKTVVLL